MKIDKNGGLTLPNELREQFGLLPGTSVELVVNQDGILIKPTESHREQVLKWLRDQHGGEMASLTTADIMRLIRED
jgi:AbrB family looped-hinge helix DNA binding protein